MASATQEEIIGDSKDLSLGKNPKFLVGVAVSVYQNSGDGDNTTNWGWFQEQKKFKAGVRLRFGFGSTDDADGMCEDHDDFLEARWDDLGPSVIEEGYKIGMASDFWNRYEEDIQLAKGLGSNAFRLSIEWSRIVPHRGHVDQEAVAHYHRIFDKIDECGMEANVTMHWFVHPLWFQELGAFTKEENIPVFVEWAQLAFELFGKRSKLWVTFNEPGVAAMCGFITGNHPPGKYLNFRGAGLSLQNMLRSHSAAYAAIRKMPGSEDVTIGIVHNVFWLEAKGDGPAYFHVRAVLKAANRIWGNEVVMNYLKTGAYQAWSPFGKDITFQEPDGRPGCDFFGVNHYARAVVDWKMQPATRGESGAPTDMGYPVYPPSLYRSISYASTLGKPVYIMENGIPGAADDENRAKWINGCLEMVEKAVKDGFDVRGFMYWTLVDNFEWNFAWILKFGLYEFIPDGRPGGGRRLKKGSEAIKKWYAEMPDLLGNLLADRPGGNVPVKSTEEREKLEQFREKEFLLLEGNYTAEELDDLISQAQPASREVPVGNGPGGNYQERHAHSLL